MLITGSIYIIKNKINKKVYIGQTTLSVEERYKQHMKPSAHKKHYKIYKAIRKHGVENFYYEVLEDNVLLDLLDEKEISYIEKYDSFKSGYNSTKGGDGRLINKVEDVESIILRVKNGESVRSIANDLGVCYETVKRALSKCGFSAMKFKMADGKLVLKMYDEGKTHIEISDILNIDQRTVSRVIKREHENPKKPRFNYDSQDTINILTDIAEGMKRKDILDKYNIGQYIYDKIIKSQKENSNDYPEME